LSNVAMADWRVVSRTLVAAAVLNAAMLFWLRGGWGHEFFATIIALWLGLPAVMIGGGLYAFASRSPRWRNIGRGFGIAGVVCISGLISIAPGQWLIERDIVEAERYCDGLIRQIEEYRRSHGSYPRDLSPIQQELLPPHLARGARYWSNGSEFGIDMGDPRGLMNFIGYSSTSRQWHAWH
jgi:hypothetical protein